MDDTVDESAHLDVARAMIPPMREIIPKALIFAVLPLVAYSILRKHVDSDAVALATVMVIPITAILYERLRNGRFDPIGVIALVGIGIGLGGALAFHGNDLLLKLRDSTLTSIFGLVCLVSLVGDRRPAMYFLARMFATAGDEDRLKVFDEIWEQPGVREGFRQVTAAWGIGLLLEAAARIALALSLSTQTFLAVSPIVAWIAIGTLIAYTIRRLKKGEVDITGALGIAPADAPEPA
jgi:intracellular septation protein A